MNFLLEEEWQQRIEEDNEHSEGSLKSVSVKIQDNAEEYKRDEDD